MENVFAIIDSYLPFILASMALIIIILLIMVVVSLSSISKLKNKFRKLSRGIENKNMEEIINGYLDKVEEVAKEGNEIKSMYDSMDQKLRGCLQKVSLVRYSAFEDVGSDLSFSVAALDERDNGVVLSGLFGRHESTAYAKPIERGRSRYDLSAEEKQVLKEAMAKK